MSLVAFLLAGLAVAAPPAVRVRCAGLNGEEKAPRLVVKAAGAHTLYVCAVQAKKKKGGLELRGFRVLQAGHKKALFESELESKPFQVVKEGDTIRARELLWNGRARVPAFETTVGCDPSGCRASAPARCVFEKPHAGSRRALEQIDDFRSGDRQGKVPPLKLVDSLAALAYSGDSDAQALFRNRGALALDGEVSEAYFDHQATLARLRKAGCL